MSQRGAVASAILLGIPLALFTGFLALGLAGAGHGWIPPIWMSGAGLVGFPAGIYAALAWRTLGRGLAGLLLAIGVLSDLAVILLTYNEGLHYFHGDDPFHLLWIGLWLSWQLPLLLALIRLQRSTGDL